MNTLFMDTHEKELVLAIYQDEKLYKMKRIAEAKDHSTVCIPSLVELLKECNLTVHDLSDIVVVIGPGSFTGVRLGVTVAKTLAYTLEIPIRAITSLECFLPIKENAKYISIPEKNGYFVGTLKEGQITEYEYLTKEEYNDLKEKETVLENLQISYETLIQEAHKKEPKNPHEVNPFYVKKIEVEK